MKTTRACPKCQSKNVGNLDGKMKRAILHHYVCFDCGYTELYAANEKTLKNLEKKTRS
ncbi:MAG: hypothetical protein LBL66_10485 [Clostridiales bacterium]|jgi:predicted nucleic-acid-binding Zn-ribbon protein|nr:hypothetical protein [Clostridiales bacterium]